MRSGPPRRGRGRQPAARWTYRRGISAGMVSVNNTTSGAEAHLPFGGNGKSGNGGRQSGQWVLDQFTRWQSMNWDHSGRSSPPPCWAAPSPSPSDTPCSPRRSRC
ncbi:aldehyde dehydrogenase family protein [Streptomyces sp. F001]|uniref:aldehyde dehydrogenase family protein n=1 Tax=Streptomyces sp. F001 TaxID=1510026 RepID=UPI0023EA5703|nr:aldehyde dehydrogenase family protein [Streptomyces sp. F001]